MTQLGRYGGFESVSLAWCRALRLPAPVWPQQEELDSVVRWQSAFGLITIEIRAGQVLEKVRVKLSMLASGGPRGGAST